LLAAAGPYSGSATTATTAPLLPRGLRQSPCRGVAGKHLSRRPVREIKLQQI